VEEDSTASLNNNKRPSGNKQPDTGATCEVVQYYEGVEGGEEDRGKVKGARSEKNKDESSPM